MNSTNAKKLLTLISAVITVFCTIGYINNVQVKFGDNLVAKADVTLKLQKEVINITTDNTVATTNTATPGDHLRYRLTYSNPGSAEVKDVKLIDVLPNNTVLVAVTDNGVYSSSDNAVTWIIPRIAQGGSGSVNYEVKASAVPDKTVIGNTAFMTASAIPQGITSNEVKTTVSAPSMALDLTVDKISVKREEKLEYTITIQNTGSMDAQSVKIMDTIPVETSFLESNITPSSIDGNVIIFNIGSIGKNEAKTIKISVIVKKNAPADSVTVNNVMLSYSDKASVEYLNILKSVSSTISGVPPTVPSGIKDATAPKTGGEFIPSLIISLILGLMITLYFYYNHEHLSFAGAKVSLASSREKISKFQNDYFSKSSLKLRMERVKIRLIKIIKQ